MDQSPSAESEHGLRADSALYLHLLLQWNVLRALFTAEALLHSSHSSFGSCGGCRNNEIIIPSSGGNETAFVPCSRLLKLGWFCSTSRATLVEAPRTFWLRQHPVAHAGAQRAWISPHSTNSPPGKFQPTESPAYPHSPQNTRCALLGRGSSGNADSRWEGIKLRLRRDSGPPELRLIPGNT